VKNIFFNCIEFYVIYVFIFHFNAKIEPFHKITNFHCSALRHHSRSKISQKMNSSAKNKSLAEIWKIFKNNRKYNFWTGSDRQKIFRFLISAQKNKFVCKISKIRNFYRMVISLEPVVIGQKFFDFWNREVENSHWPNF